MDSMTLQQAREGAGHLRGSSDWVAIDQQAISRFAELTGDDAFIHVDPVAAARTRYRGTIAHGLFTLSLLPMMMRTAMPSLAGLRMSTNYGFERIRFVAPVPAGSRLRGHFLLTDISERKPGFQVFSYEVLVEIEAQKLTHALAATWLLGRWFQRE